MKSRLKAMVKNSKVFYKLYFICGSLLLRFVGLFVKTDPDLLLFVSYGGRKYDDSPRVLYEYLLKHPVSEKHKYVWAFVNPKEYPEVENSIVIDTPQYYLTALRAGYWITNSSVSRGLNFQKKGTRNILFEHGTVGIKRILTDVLQPEKIFVTAFHEQYNQVFIEGKKEVPILSRVWKLDESVFHLTGLPRNDDLVDISPEKLNQIRNRLGIPEGKKVILYAPTFRDYDKAEDGRTALRIPMDFEKWEACLGKDYAFVITAHYEVAKLLDTLPANGFVINAFGYPRINDLLKVADILISDYSSVVFDYSILERPILCYGYDYDVFSVKRGTYMDINELFSHGIIRDEDTLIRAITEMDYPAQCRYTAEHIKKEHIASYGNAAEKAAKIIFG